MTNQIIFMRLRQLIFSLWLLPILAGMTLLLYRVLPYGSEVVEHWYSRGIFEVYRYIWDYTVGLLPFGLIYLLIGGVLYVLLAPIFSRSSARQQLWVILKRIVMLVSIGIISFYWLWAFNYKRSDFRTTSGLERMTPNEDFVYQEYCRVTDSLVMLKQKLLASPPDETPVDEGMLRTDLELVYERMDLPYAGRVRAIKIRPKGSLLHISTAGVYLPFVGEGHIDAGLHPITHPFTMMHEMSHGYGWTGEDVCNFLALIGTINSPHPRIRYSGYFGYWRYLRSQVYRMDPERFDEYYREVHPLVMQDYRDILAYADRYPDILPKLRNLFYDNYLKSHGIASGLVSYSEMIILSFEWQTKYGALTLDGSL